MFEDIAFLLTRKFYILFLSIRLSQIYYTNTYEKTNFFLFLRYKVQCICEITRDSIKILASLRIQN